MTEYISLRYVDLMPRFKVRWWRGRAWVLIPAAHHELRRCVPAGADGDGVMAEARRRLAEILRIHKAGGTRRDDMGSMMEPGALVPVGVWRLYMGAAIPGYVIEVDADTAGGGDAD